MALHKFESMLKTNQVFFFDATEFEEIIHHYIDNGKHALAKKALLMGLEQHPTSITIKLLEAELFVFENELAKASVLLKEINQIEPTNDEVYIQMAAIKSKQNLHDEAIVQLIHALRYTDDEEDVRSLLGVEYMYTESYSKADDYASLYNLIFSLEQTASYNKAISILNDVIDRNPYSEIAWHQLGKQHLHLNQLDEALRAFDYAVTIDESFIGGYIEKAKVLEKLNKYKEAINNYGISLDLDDPTAYIHFRIAQCYLKLNNVSTSIKHLKFALVEDPLHEKSWEALADLYFEKKKFDDSLFHLNKIIEFNDSNPIIWLKYAKTQYRLNEISKAIEGAKKCIKLQEYNIEAWLLLIDLTFISKNIDLALEYTLEAESIFGYELVIKTRLIAIYYTLKQTNKCIDIMNQCEADSKNLKLLLEDFIPGLNNDNELKSFLEN